MSITFDKEIKTTLAICDICNKKLYHEGDPFLAEEFQIEQMKIITKRNSWKTFRQGEFRYDFCSNDCATLYEKINLQNDMKKVTELQNLTTHTLYSDNQAILEYCKTKTFKAYDDMGMFLFKVKKLKDGDQC
ncbi:MAG: hypothetical protein FWE01_03195 [Firmicutes bacterium]|nr:hypothetical protein [Bacillota bacterium]